MRLNGAVVAVMRNRDCPLEAWGNRDTPHLIWGFIRLQLKTPRLGIQHRHSDAEISAPACRELHHQIWRGLRLREGGYELDRAATSPNLNVARASSRIDLRGAVSSPRSPAIPASAKRFRSTSGCSGKPRCGSDAAVWATPQEACL
jgi:hypothetical protein